MGQQHAFRHDALDAIKPGLAAIHAHGNQRANGFFVGLLPIDDVIHFHVFYPHQQVGRRDCTPVIAHQ
jgi:hypothetical protein